MRGAHASRVRDHEAEDAREKPRTARQIPEPRPPRAQVDTEAAIRPPGADSRGRGRPSPSRGVLWHAVGEAHHGSPASPPVAHRLLVASPPRARRLRLDRGLAGRPSGPARARRPALGRRHRRHLREAGRPRSGPARRLPRPVGARPGGEEGRNARRALDERDVDRAGPAARPLPPARHEADRRPRQRRRARQPRRQGVRRARGRTGRRLRRPPEGARLLDRRPGAHGRRARRPRDHRRPQGRPPETPAAASAPARRDRRSRWAGRAARAGPPRPRLPPSTSSRLPDPSSPRGASR